MFSFFKILKRIRRKINQMIISNCLLLTLGVLSMINICEGYMFLNNNLKYIGVHITPRRNDDLAVKNTKTLGLDLSITHR